MQDDIQGSVEPENAVDPLIWHYQRERRMKIGGSVVWDHTVESKDKDRNFTIKANFAFVSNSCFIDVLIPSTIPPEFLSSIFAFVKQNAEKYATTGPFEMKFPIK